MNNPTLRARVRRHLDRIYPDLGDGELESLAASILAATGIDEARMADVQSQLPGSDEVVPTSLRDIKIDKAFRDPGTHKVTVKDGPNTIDLEIAAK